MLSIDGSCLIEGVFGVMLFGVLGVLGVLGLVPVFAAVLLLFVPDEDEVNNDLTLEDARDARCVPLPAPEVLLRKSVRYDDAPSG